MSSAVFDRTPILPERLRRIEGTFGYLPHQLLRDGHWDSLEHSEILLYVLLALVADRQGMSFYRNDRLAAVLRLRTDQLLDARHGLIQKGYVAYDPAGPRYQLLSLPPRPLRMLKPLEPVEEKAGSRSRRGPPEHVRELLRKILGPSAR